MATKGGKQKSTEQRVAPPRNPWALSGRLGASATVWRRLTYNTTLASAGYLAVDTSAMASSTEWSALSTQYGSARVASMRVTAIPSANLSSSGGFHLYCTTRGTSVASSIAALWSGENAKLLIADVTTKQPAYYEVRATGFTDFEWVPVAAFAGGNNLFGLKLYNGDGSTANVFVEFMVEFRSVLS